MVLGLSACGSVKIRDVNEAELMKVKKVAIASFSFEQPKNKTSGGVGIAEDSEDAAGALKDISGILAKRMQWTILSADEMRKNPEYEKVYTAKMKGWQMNKVPVPGRLLIAPGVMDAQTLFRMKPPERDALMVALGVDALIEARVSIAFATKGVAVMGIGDRYPQASVIVRMYKRGIEQPVWFDGHMQGEAATESVGKTAFWDEADVTRLGRISARSAFEKVSLKQEQL
jgi:hypothetical protein